IPSLPVKEVDLPVITTMPDVGEPEAGEEDIAVSFLPELPIIGIEAIVADEVPVAVSMNGDVVLMEESPEITAILPELIITEITKDTPLVEELTAGEPDAESAEKDELSPPLPEPLAAEIGEETAAPETGAPRVDELAVQDHEPEEELSVSSIIPEIVVPGEETLPVSPLPELEMPKDGVEIVLEPSEYRPPVVVEKEIPVPETVEPGADEESEVITPEIDKAPSPESAEALDRENFNITRELVKDSYYLQLGAYREEYSALDLAGQLEGIYPVTVYVSESRDVVSYKVMVGPLGLDESGVILYNFKSMGYQDAFLRKGL
ncbi:MAG: SPOR domain-containing protein, partial [Spirochaetales bacterium]|nr:SPOR domain-containing protein [Spirochaetales bacterium]